MNINLSSMKCVLICLCRYGNFVAHSFQICTFKQRFLLLLKRDLKYLSKLDPFKISRDNFTYILGLLIQKKMRILSLYLFITTHMAQVFAICWWDSALSLHFSRFFLCFVDLPLNFKRFPVDLRLDLAFHSLQTFYLSTWLNIRLQHILCSIILFNY